MNLNNVQGLIFCNTKLASKSSVTETLAPTYVYCIHYFYWLGNVPAEETPQIVLMTFDDAINDLNKQYYSELFESGRKNPNGCPIAATFYISHEWTDYSQVQNLYADGHEMASHTVS